jgi:hypothetical protein
LDDAKGWAWRGFGGTERVESELIPLEEDRAVFVVAAWTGAILLFQWLCSGDGARVDLWADASEGGWMLVSGGLDTAGSEFFRSRNG